MKRSLGNAITSLDAFGAPISLTFNGKTSFQTTRGGILTVIIYFLTFWQIWTQVSQLYTQTDPITSAYETSYVPETSVNLPNLKQLITLGFRDVRKNKWINELDPRAIRFLPSYKSGSSGKMQAAEFEWCDPNQNDDLNIVNEDNL